MTSLDSESPVQDRPANQRGQDSPKVRKTKERPHIPPVVARQLLVEAGHRCAVCGEPCPLERAHIIPWRLSKAHTLEDLICLCANCHQRADIEDWGESTLREYKRRPWILRRFVEREEPSTTKRVEITLDLELDSFTSLEERLLVFALAAFLNVDPTRIRIASIEEGSIRITLELSGKSANKLMAAAHADSEDLKLFLRPLNVNTIKWPDDVDLVSIKAEGSGDDYIIELSPLPPSLDDEDLRELTSSLGSVRSISLCREYPSPKSYAMIRTTLDVARKIVSLLLHEGLAGRDFLIYRSGLELLGLEPTERSIGSAEEFYRRWRERRARASTESSTIQADNAEPTMAGQDEASHTNEHPIGRGGDASVERQNRSA